VRSIGIQLIDREQNWAVRCLTSQREKMMDRTALRWWLPILAVAICLTCMLTQPPAPEVDTTAWVVEVPAPPFQAFVIAVLALPGLIFILPLMLVLAVLQAPSAITNALLLLGTGVFWYAAGFRFDSERGVLKERAREPRWMGIYFSILKYTSAVVLVLTFLTVLFYREHFGSPPLWSQVIVMGIAFSWSFVGAMPLIRQLRTAGQRHREGASLER
jgi:hypothetical protein